MPARITIEDVTEAPDTSDLEDKDPKVVKDNLWGAVSSPVSPHDEHVNWLLTLDNSVRVYRFTVKLNGWDDPCASTSPSSCRPG